MSANPLAKLDQARAYLAECRSLPEVKKIRDLALAAREYARAQKLGIEAQNYAWEVRVEAERRMITLLDGLPKSKGGRPENSPTQRGSFSSEYRATLDELEASTQEASRWRLLAQVPVTVIAKYAASCIDGEQEPTAKGCLAFASAKNGQALVTSDSNEWYTSSEYIEAARDVLGAIDLDPASHPAANEVVKAAQFFTAEDDGLSQEWQGRVWLNPPWGDIGPTFVARLIESYEQGGVTAAILLVNAHATDTIWFQPLWDYLLCFTCPRIRYWQPDGGGNSPTHGSVFVYFGPEPERFYEVFAPFGAIVSRNPELLRRAAYCVASTPQKPFQARPAAS